MKNLVTVLLLALFLCGCATAPDQFYGIKVDSVFSAPKFKIKSYAEEEVRFEFNHNTMDKNISAWARISYLTLILSVKNNSASPISTNYYTDKFTLFTRDGRTYFLEKGDILIYPSRRGGYINPGTKAYFNLPLPSSLSNLKKEDVEMIVCALGVFRQKNTIILKPLPEKIVTK